MKNLTHITTLLARNLIKVSILKRSFLHRIIGILIELVSSLLITNVTWQWLYFLFGQRDHLQFSLLRLELQIAWSRVLCPLGVMVNNVPTLLLDLEFRVQNIGSMFKLVQSFLVQAHHILMFTLVHQPLNHEVRGQRSDRSEVFEDITSAPPKFQFELGAFLGLLRSIILDLLCFCYS